jgi:hypothetical protein
MKEAEDKALFDMDFAEIEARIILAMSEEKLGPPPECSPTGRNPSELPPFHKLPRK